MRISNIENDSFALLPIFAYDDDYLPLSPLGTSSSSKDKSQQNPLSELSDDHLSQSTLHSPEPNNSSTKSDSDMDILDIQQLNDPQVGKTSTFNYKDSDEQYQITIYGKKKNFSLDKFSNSFDCRRFAWRSDFLSNRTISH